MTTQALKLAVWKFSSCDGCQLSLLDCGQDLLALTRELEIAVFLEASRAETPGPYDISLVEGSISTPEEARRIAEVRAESRLLVAIGACATSGGIQALRALHDLDDLVRAVYPRPELINSLPAASPLSAYVAVDYALPGCPVDRHRLLALLEALLHGRRPCLPGYAQCLECKMAGTVCLLVAAGTPCLGPVTRAGCGNVCPPWGRGCFGCFGPKEEAHPAPLSEALLALGQERRRLADGYRLFTCAAPEFSDEAARLSREDVEGLHD
ncbi:MAG: oxidoreductase [Desulfobulbaceae bacterium A2]|nr:MAG: oxidoreductase [Desulfobulbaceae bacterium A2]